MHTPASLTGTAPLPCTAPPVPGGGVPLGMTTLADVLKRANYSTHMIGKYHMGMSSVGRLPVNRGFDSSFGYLSGAEDVRFISKHHPWTYLSCSPPHPALITRELQHYDQSRDGEVDFWRNDGPANRENGTAYSTFQYAREAERIINANDGAQSLFLYMAFQNTHAPLQVWKGAGKGEEFAPSQLPACF